MQDAVQPLPILSKEAVLDRSCTGAEVTPIADSEFNTGSTGDLTSPTQQAAKRRSFFAASTKVNPLDAAEEVATHQAGPECKTAAPQQKVSWSDLPENVVEHLFKMIKVDLLHQEVKVELLDPLVETFTQQSIDQAVNEHVANLYRSAQRRRQRSEIEDEMLATAHKLGCVCRTWKQIARLTFFSDWWTNGKIIHPLQCFSLAPHMHVGLLKCYVKRVRVKNCMRFLIYQADKPDAADGKFLMAADVNRFGMTLYFTKTESQPCARISSNIFCTRYEFIKAGNLGPFDPQHHQLPATAHQEEALCLADVEYRTRIRGCMKPRRMRVLLPGRSVLQQFGPVAQKHPALFEQPAQPSPLPSPMPAAPPNTPVSRLAAPHASSAERKLGVWEAIPSAPLQRQGEWLELENKAPHWNENLKCWCLNFRGRVKFASVKNFQLVDLTNTEAVVMQFGKVGLNSYILDFQPGAISAAQAFAIALSAFNKGFTP